MNQNRIRQIKKYVITFVVLILCGILLLTLVSIFPSSWIKENVRKSSETLVKEGNKKVYFSMSHLQFLEFDNYSDALMINTAYSIDNKTPLYSIFVARKNYIPGVTEKIIEDFVGDLESNSNKYNKLDQVDELYDTVNGDAPESYEYGRYWHGYMIFLRPLLIFFDYWQIRILLIFVLAVLAIYFLTLIEERFGKYICFTFGFVLFEIDYFYIGLSLFNIPMAVVMMIFAIFLLKNFEKIKDFSFIFFTVGCLVGFFDLLDYPLITYEIGILIYLLCTTKNRKYSVNIKQDIVDIIKLGFFWIIGYIITWVTKWILIDVIYHKNLLKTSLYQIIFRSSNQVMWGKKLITVNPLLSIGFNIIYMAIPILLNIILGIIIICKKPNNFSISRIKNTVPFLVVGLIPFVWLGVFTNHSFQHSFFTCRILFITLFVLLIIPEILLGIVFNNEKKEV